MTRQIFTNKWGSDVGSSVQPSNSKIDLGYILERPPFEYMNWVENRQDEMLDHISKNGISEWIATETFNLNGLTLKNGIIYKSLQSNNINKDPETESSWWTTDVIVNASTTVKGINYLNKYITISNNIVDGNFDIDFSEGNFDFSDKTGQAIATAQTKQIDSFWALGTNQGGIPSRVTKTGTYSTSGTAVIGLGTSFDTEFFIGDILWSDSKGQGRQIQSVDSPTSMTLVTSFATDVLAGETVKKNGLAPNSLYNCFKLSNNDGSIVDSGFDGDINCSNLLNDTNIIAAGLTKYKRRGAVLTDASGSIIPFNYIVLKDGSARIMYNPKIYILALGGTSVSSTPTDKILNEVPRGVKINPIFTTYLRSTGDDTISLIEKDSNSLFVVNYVVNAEEYGICSQIFTDVNGVFQYSNNGSTAFVDLSYDIWLNGYIDLLID